jgi:hypothetical protein
MSDSIIHCSLHWYHLSQRYRLGPTVPVSPRMVNAANLLPVTSFSFLFRKPRLVLNIKIRDENTKCIFYSHIIPGPSFTWYYCFIHPRSLNGHYAGIFMVRNNVQRRVAFSNSMNNSTDQSPSWQTNCRSVTQEIPRLSWKPKVRDRIHKTRY